MANFWESFRRVLNKKLRGIPREDVSGNLHFGKNKEAWEAFKEAFNPNVKVPDYLEKRREFYETGEYIIAGIKFDLWGSYSPNPNWVALTKEEREKEQAESWFKDEWVALLLWEMMAKGLFSFDREKVHAVFYSRGYDWDDFYGRALTRFSEVEVKEKLVKEKAEEES